MSIFSVKFDVTRSIEIQAAREQVFDVVADFGTWTTWSPWLCSEPGADVEVTGAAKSVGSRYRWSGDIVGAGEIEHIHIEPDCTRIEDELRFERPFKSTSLVEFALEAIAEDRTRLTWTMHGSLAWFLFWMKSMMTTMIGMDYERGLRMIKELVESGKVSSETTVKGIEEVSAIHVVGVRRRCSMQDVGESMKAAFEEVKQGLEQQGIETHGDDVSIYHCTDMKKQEFDYTAGVSAPDQEPPAGLSSWSVPAGKALVVHHKGRYEHLGNAWSAAYQHARHLKVKPTKHGAYEIYRNDPATTDPSDLLTDIYLPLR